MTLCESKNERILGYKLVHAIEYQIQCGCGAVSVLRSMLYGGVMCVLVFQLRSIDQIIIHNLVTG